MIRVCDGQGRPLFYLTQVVGQELSACLWLTRSQFIGRTCCLPNSDVQVAAIGDNDPISRTYSIERIVHTGDCFQNSG